MARQISKSKLTEQEAYVLHLVMLEHDVLDPKSDVLAIPEWRLQLLLPGYSSSDLQRVLSVAKAEGLFVDVSSGWIITLREDDQ